MARRKIWGYWDFFLILFSSNSAKISTSTETAMLSNPLRSSCHPDQRQEIEGKSFNSFRPKSAELTQNFEKTFHRETSGGAPVDITFPYEREEVLRKNPISFFETWLPC